MTRRAAWALSVLFVLAGCEVEPYCLSCDDGGGMDGGGGDGGAMDGGNVDSGPPVDAGPVDGGPPDGCLDSERCNDLDDDCDGVTDEGFDLDTNPDHCGACNDRCAPVHAFGVCEGGACTLGACDVNWYDLDGDPANGCEYRCVGTETSEVRCDLADDDCDGMVDEDFDLMTDGMNCGRCGRQCDPINGTGACVAGSCTLDSCDPGFQDIDGRLVNGCEYACTPAADPTETCNAADDDCDGVVDESVASIGDVCGTTDVGECQQGTYSACTSARLICTGNIEPVSETCNGLDDDCDGTADDSPTDEGRVCSTGAGVCVIGAEMCSSGSLSCTCPSGYTRIDDATRGPLCLPTGRTLTETCNNLDDDCDGSMDEGTGGATCGSDVGECSSGTIACRSGALVCEGAVTARAETCNGLDDNCDGTADEGDPGGGVLCGTDVGVCAPGTTQCSTAGAIVCNCPSGFDTVMDSRGSFCVPSGATLTEVCNGQDDDCDGAVDEGNPGGGGSCGLTVGACTAGTIMCRSGTLVCEGAGGPVAETCNTADDDCDGATDEDFSLMSDVNNCGGCGTVCNLPNAFEACSSGTCVVSSCESGFHDLDPTMPGCEYACSVAGSEVCNGVDDDCNGVIDEGLTAPSGYCNPNGVCAGTTATCTGTGGWQCIYGSTFEESEASCDTLDNDCDGFVDEAFPLLGDGCGNGTGSCRRAGTIVCNTAGDGVMCNAAAAGSPADEECNGQDDDCDGSVDERVPDDPGTAWRDGVDVTAIDTVAVDVGGGVIVDVMAYEASRADASSGAAGSLSEIACSRPNVRPWTNVTWDQAQDACCALNPSGTCPAAGSTGWRLCEAPEWETACQGPGGSCEWSYSSMCTSSQRLACNGAEHDCDPSTQGDQDCLYNTGSSTFPMCYADWGVEGAIYDLSGNVREWTATNRGGDFYEVRGGSFNHIEEGRSCDWDFTVARRTTTAPNTGFRCCRY